MHLRLRKMQLVNLPTIAGWAGAELSEKDG